MKILVIGGSSLIGYSLVERLKEENDVSLTYWNHPVHIPGATGFTADLSDSKQIIKIIEKTMPKTVVHVAAPPSVDAHDKDKVLAYQINVLTTHEIAKKTYEIGSKLVYLSTSNVFPLFKKIFTEEDIPAPVNFYGACKLGGELAAQKNPDSIVVRTDQIYGWSQFKGQKKSFVVNTLEKIEQGTCEVCKDWYNTPTYVDDLAKAMECLIRLNKRGVYHCVGSSFLNRLEWGKKIAEKFGKDHTRVKGICSETLALPALRANVHLSNKKIQKETGIRMKTVDEGLDAMEQTKQS